MIAPIQPEPEEPPRNEGVASGGQGSGPSNGEGVLSGTQHFHQDKAMSVKALKRWNIGRHKRKRVVSKLCDWIESEEPKISIAACKALIDADSINVRLALGAENTTVNVGVNIVNTSIESLLAAPGYVEFLESRDDRNPGTVCPNGDAGQVLPPPPHSGNLNGNHGHNHGEN